MSNHPVPTLSGFPACFAGRGVMSVTEFLEWANISRFTFYKEVRCGRIRPRKVGARTIIPLEEANRWLSALPEVNDVAVV